MGKFKVDDTVYLGNKKGQIVAILYTTRPHNPLEVAFSDGTIDFYTETGQNFKHDVFHVLSFTPYTVEQTPDGLLLKGFSQVRPYEPKKGDLVWCWDENDENDRFLNIFIGKTSTGKFKGVTNKLKTNTYAWKYCKPYKP